MGHEFGPYAVRGMLAGAECLNPPPKVLDRFSGPIASAKVDLARANQEFGHIVGPRGPKQCL